MNRMALPLLCGVLLVAGCQSRSETAATPAPFKLNKRKSVEITPANEEFGQHRAEARTANRKREGKSSRAPTEIGESELYQLPKFTVTRKGFLNFGLSVITNVEVTLGGKIEWMRVGVVLPGLPASRQGLFTGVEILAIDGTPISQLSREDMLHALFERESGDHVRLLVYSRHLGSLPRFVSL